MAVEIKSVWGPTVVELVQKYNTATKAKDTASVLSIVRNLLTLATGSDMKVILRAAQALEKIGHKNWDAIKEISKEIIAAFEKDSFKDKAARDIVVIALRWAYPEIDSRATSAEIINQAKKYLQINI
jgi:hypothetical protein